MRKSTITIGVAAIIIGLSVAAGQEFRFGGEVGGDASVFDDFKEPSTIGAHPPKIDDHSKLLFDGEHWIGWVTHEGKPSEWEPQDDKSVLVKGGDAMTVREYGDLQLHIEFLCPKAEGRTGQGRSNSGVYLQGRYEIQVLDSKGDEALPNGCGSIYGIAAPLVNAAREAGAWQSYDIVFRAPRVDESDHVTEKPRVTVIHNGVVIHNNLMVPKPTGGALGTDMPARGPIMLQDHGDPVRYRNIWIREL